MSTTNFVGLNDNTADIEIGTTFGVVDNMTWTHGRHAFKTGMEIRRVRLNQGQTADNVLSFASRPTWRMPALQHHLHRALVLPWPAPHVLHAVLSG